MDYSQTILARLAPGKGIVDVPLYSCVADGHTYDVTHAADGSLVYRTDMGDWTYNSSPMHREIVRHYAVPLRADESVTGGDDGA